MKNFLLAGCSLSLLITSAFADWTTLSCSNGGSEFQVTKTANGTQFSMNSGLISALQQQGESVQSTGSGQISKETPCISFFAGAPSGYSLSLDCDVSGGQLLSYTDYSNFSYGRADATFYFHPNECQAN